MFKIVPKTNLIIDQLIDYIRSSNSDLFEDGPIQFLFPQVFNENIKQLSVQLNNLPFPIKIFFAHKANKSQVFVREAKKSGINIDVASLNELRNALKEGYDGEEIECSGIKNTKFIQKCLKNDCLIIIDSVSEFNLIKQHMQKNKKARIAFRINDPYCDNSCYNRTSRFGIKKQEFIELIRTQNLSDFKIEGLHLHFDEYIPENKANMVKELVSLYKYLFNKDVFPSMVNIGGGYRFPVVEANNKDKILEDIEKIDFDEISYAKTIFGLEKGRNGKISKTHVSDKFFPLEASKFLTKVFDLTGDKSKLIEELNLSVHIEPGYALLDSCGCIIMKVIGTKDLVDNRFAVIVDGNMYNLSTQMRKWVTDPIHISKNKNSSNDSCEAFIFGNLCKEDDVLLDRKVYFDNKPKIGDLLVFVNTAGYAGNFEDTDAILQPKNKNFVCLVEDKNIIILSEKEYLRGKK